MRCLICSRPLGATAAPGLAIGPVCAKKRGLLPDKVPRVRLADLRHTTPDAGQLDWIDADSVSLASPADATAMGG